MPHACAGIVSGTWECEWIPYLLDMKHGKYEAPSQLDTHLQHPEAPSNIPSGTQNRYQKTAHASQALNKQGAVVLLVNRFELVSALYITTTEYT